MPTAATIFTHWKSSSIGILMFVVVTCGVLGANSLMSVHAASIVALIGSLASAYIALLMKDAGVQVAQVYGGPPKAVPAHELPDDPAAKPVVGK